MEITGLKKHILCMKKPDIVRTQKICYNINNSTRRASDRKVKQAGLFILGDFIVINIFNLGIELIEFICYNINNKPATPLNLRVKAHFRQAFFLGGNI